MLLSNLASEVSTTSFPILAEDARGGVLGDLVKLLPVVVEAL